MRKTIKNPLLGVFLPFHNNFSFIYEAIQKVAETINRSKGMSMIVKKADDDYSPNAYKIVDIKKLIQECDIAIFDITENRPNVMHEFGMADAHEKDCIIICQEGSEIPENIKNRDRVPYKFSVKGIDALINTLVLLISNIITQKNGLERDKKLADDKEIKNYISNIGNGLRHIESESLIANLVKGELQRISKRVSRIREEQTFDLRTMKPNSEVIQYYVDYASQLNSGNCKLYTITHFDFWRFITEKGTNWSYFEANVFSASAGTRIKRIFRIPNLNKDGFKKSDKELFDEPFIRILLTKHLEAMKENSHFETRLLFVAMPDDTRTDKIGNTALWYKEDEKLYFMPRYTDEDNIKKLSITDFYYWSETVPNDAHAELFEKYENRFHEIWESSIVLSDEHLKF